VQKRKTLESLSDFSLVQVDVQDESDNVTRTTYEVIELDENVVGRFGSLKEAQSFIQIITAPEEDVDNEQASKDEKKVIIHPYI
jgi:hypothetical protein